MSGITLITGGARSGKSAYALKIAMESPLKRAFVATAVSTDDEMTARIRAHRKERGEDFDAFEEPYELSKLLEKIAPRYNVIVVDCVTFFINNLMFKGKSDNEIYESFSNIISALKGRPCETIFVTNEVGLGIVPENPLARRFRDVQGRVNQMLAGAGNSVYFLVSGIPMKIK